VELPGHRPSVQAGTSSEPSHRLPVLCARRLAVNQREVPLTVPQQGGLRARDRAMALVRPGGGPVALGGDQVAAAVAVLGSG